MATTKSPSFRNAILGFIERRRRRAGRYVADADHDMERSVHELRRMCKELRALWRVLRPVVGDEVYSRENVRLRDAARSLAGARDAAVVLDTFGDLKKRRRGRRGRENWKQIGEIFQSHITETLGDALAPATPERLAPALTGALDAFSATHEAIDSLPPEVELAWQPGVRQVYKTGRKRMKNAYESDADADFHNWRKSTKYLFYQLRLLERLRQARPGRRVKELKQLEKVLGRDHDLAVLRDRIARLAPADEGARARVLYDIQRDSARMRKLANKPGKKLFEEKPAEFVEAIAKRSPRPPDMQPEPAHAID